MRSKLRTATRVLKNKGLLTLVERASEYAYRKYIGPDEVHIQRLRERENLVIAEIGVLRGENADRLARELDVEEMYLIDPYDAHEDYVDPMSGSEKLRAAKKEAHNKLNNNSDINWIEKPSGEAVAEIDRKLDYVYVDGNHSYEFVKNDIENYYPLVKEGGILAGDDIDWSGVSQAFVEFAVENDLQPHLEPYHPDWYFIKGQKMQSQRGESNK